MKLFSNYSWDQTELAEALEVLMGSARLVKVPDTIEVFMTCQCQLETINGFVYRGQVSSVIIDRHKQNVKIIFKWLCNRRSFYDRELGAQQEEWFLLSQPPSGFHFLNMDYVKFYVQKDEARLKLKGHREWGRFYQKGDFTNLVWHESKFVSYCKLHKQEFWQAVIAILLARKLKT